MQLLISCGSFMQLSSQILLIMDTICLDIHGVCFFWSSYHFSYYHHSSNIGNYRVISTFHILLSIPYIKLFNKLYYKLSATIISVCNDIGRIVSLFQKIRLPKNQHKIDVLLKKKNQLVQDNIQKLNSLISTSSFDDLQLTSSKILKKGYIKFLIGVLETIEKKSKISK